ncbi:hypothetical protein BH10BAC5_BH10BAC5_20970 [soil metagenome]
MAKQSSVVKKIKDIGKVKIKKDPSAIFIEELRCDPGFPAKKKFAVHIVKKLKELYPEPKCHLDVRSPFELLVSTVLAAQFRDIMVNKIMVPLYKTKYKKPKDIVDDGLENLKSNLKGVNFYNNKSANVYGISKVLVEKYKGKVPDNMEELVELPGVGRKSASVVLGNYFGKEDVIIVDTHLKRVSQRLGIVESDDPGKIELELKELIPDNEQFRFSMRIGEHGRQICHARNPDHENCVFKKECSYYRSLQ